MPKICGYIREGCLCWEWPLTEEKIKKITLLFHYTCNKIEVPGTQYGTDNCYHISLVIFHNHEWLRSVSKEFSNVSQQTCTRDRKLCKTVANVSILKANHVWQLFFRGGGYNGSIHTIWLFCCCGWYFVLFWKKETLTKFYTLCDLIALRYSKESMYQHYM